MRFATAFMKKGTVESDDEEDIMAVRSANKRGRQRCGIILATSFVVVVAVVVSTVWNVRWGQRDIESLVPPPTPLSFSTSPPVAEEEITPSSGFTIPTIGCNGLESLCNLPVNQITFATAHNAAATSDVQIVAPNHDKSIMEALEAGYRGLNVDVGLCNGQFRLVHNSCVFGTDDLGERMREIAAFMATRPRDVLLITMELNLASGGGFTVDSLENYIRTNAPEFLSLLYAGSADQSSWPTLNQLTSVLETPIMLFHYGAERCGPSCPQGFLEWFDYAVETPFSFDTTAELLQNTANSCSVTRGQAGTGDFYGVNVFTKIPSSYSCQILNSAANLQAHLETCEELTGRSVGLVLVDCWDRGDVLRVVQNMNARLL